MSLLRRTRGEVAGAIRSLRYDLGRQPAPPPAAGPDMTSTGMSTFGGVTPVAEPPSGPVPSRPPRRALAVSALGLLTVVGATGAYLGVVTGLGSATAEPPAAADTVALRPAATPNARIGTGPAARAPRRAAGATATAPAAAVPAASPAGVTAGLPAGLPPAAQAPAPPPAAAAPHRTGARPARTTGATSPECACRPPVPTPTAPASAPSETPSPSPSAPDAPSEAPSATPGDSAEPSQSTRTWHRRHH